MKEIDLNLFAQHIHIDAVKKGFYDHPREIGTLLMLIVSELSEALEADRKSFHVNITKIPGYCDPVVFKEKVKDSFEDEIADAIIRLFDLVGYLNIDIAAHIEAKLNYNKMRESMHGKLY